MKKIPKKLLDECIEASRAYWNSESFSASLLNAKKKTAQKLSKAIGIDWLAVENFVDALLDPRGLYPDVENDEIYCVLHCLGWMEDADK